jgi:hypothetical protein
MNIYLYRVRLRLLGSMRLDKFPGIALEGALTAGIREASCACRDEEAQAACPIQRRCAYHLVPRPAAELFPALPKRYGTPPPPLILRPRFASGTYGRGTELELELVLVGRAQESYHWVLAGLAAAGRRGVGPIRSGALRDGQFEVLDVEVVAPRGEMPLWESASNHVPHEPWRFPADFEGPVPPSLSRGSFTVELRSPTLIEATGAARGSLEFRHLIAAIGKRASLLSLLVSDRNIVDAAEHARLQGLASAVSLEASGCQWQTWKRHSRPQGRSFPVEGWTGWVRYRGEVTPFLPLLRLATLLHVSSHAIRGFGEIGLRGSP